MARFVAVLLLILVVWRRLCYGHSRLFRRLLFRFHYTFLSTVSNVGSFLFMTAFSSLLPGVWGRLKGLCEPV
jgi:hypothetical protein